MSWLLPTLLLPIAGVLALALVWPRMGQPSTTRLIAEAFAITLGAVGIVWAAWVALWLVEQRW